MSYKTAWKKLKEKIEMLDGLYDEYHKDITEKRGTINQHSIQFEGNIQGRLQLFSLIHQYIFDIEIEEIPESESHLDCEQCTREECLFPKKEGYSITNICEDCGWDVDLEDIKYCYKCRAPVCIDCVEDGGLCSSCSLKEFNYMKG